MVMRGDTLDEAILYLNLCRQQCDLPVLCNREKLDAYIKEKIDFIMDKSNPKYNSKHK